MPETNKPGEFKTSLVGFKKADVLAYIDKLSAETMAKQIACDTRIDSLEQDLNHLREDNDTLLERAQNLCDRLSAEMKRAENEEKRARVLAEQLLHSEENGRNLQNRLHFREQEIAALKGDNKHLSERLDSFREEHRELSEHARLTEQQLNERTEECRKLELQHQSDLKEIQRQKQEYEERLRQQLEQYTEQLACCNNSDGAAEPEAAGEEAALTAIRKHSEDEISRLQQQNEEQIRELGRRQEKLREELDTSRIRLEKEAEIRQKRIRRDAQNVADSVLMLREQLGLVDRKIAEASRRLQNMTVSIYEALDEAERDLEGLGANLDGESFAFSSPRYIRNRADQTRSARVRSLMRRARELQLAEEAAARRKSSRKTVSESLLELLERLLRS